MGNAYFAGFVQRTLCVDSLLNLYKIRFCNDKMLNGQNFSIALVWSTCHISYVGRGETPSIPTVANDKTQTVSKTSQHVTWPINLQVPLKLQEQERTFNTMLNLRGEKLSLSSEPSEIGSAAILLISDAERFARGFFKLYFYTALYAERFSPTYRFLSESKCITWSGRRFRAWGSECVEGVMRRLKIGTSCRH